MHIAVTRNRFERNVEILNETQPVKPVGLTETLLAIQENRGALYMLDISRSLIEKWDLRFDELDAQSNETRKLVTGLLKA
jgi:hypothetical protein